MANRDPALTPPTLVLASASPRRRELLARLGLPFTVRPAGLEETLAPGRSPAEQAEHLARAKAQAVWRETGGWVVAADTVVALEDAVLGKPRTPEENRAFLERLSGRAHTVYTGLALYTPGGEGRSLVEAARVWFRDLEPWEVDWYVRSGEGMDKAGGYGIQEKGMVLVRRVEGDFYTVVGLPVHRLWTLLKEVGYPLA
ncbi:Maf family protein [Marinithermus hydrothermalis]|uniref:dTTP/UTP pyrophosphatase n=1 Tax=Marinithermus hydrothermalis (strain DSM 14884 / JCM 11576 / T1) TaxID=869210 RepID=F2NLW2_MARHT|nr:Maf family protein [Marinithermus hydrothermalis]AEB11219.1 Septum formation protein Maf [Marinithermus hydrothermalis DSM 14884]